MLSPSRLFWRPFDLKLDGRPGQDLARSRRGRGFLSGLCLFLLTFCELVLGLGDDLPRQEAAVVAEAGSGMKNSTWPSSGKLNMVRYGYFVPP